MSVSVYDTVEDAGSALASAVAAAIMRNIELTGRSVCIFSSGRSQDSFLDALVVNKGIEWTRVIGFHFFEFAGVDEYSPVSQKKYLLDRLVPKVPIAEFHGIRGEAANPAAVCVNYSALLESRPPDVAVLEIGGRGRLGLITPEVCDFDDRSKVRLVEIDDQTRQEISLNGIDQVPGKGITLTMPAILSAQSIFAIACGRDKSQSIYDAVSSPITTDCPASAFRNHANATLFLDKDAAGLVRDAQSGR